MIEFGTWSTILLLGSLHGAVVAALLATARRNRQANRFLAALLAGVVLMITPYTIGYAGFYDAYPWLTFAPFYWQLGFGPALYFYVRQLGGSPLPRRWAWHFLPVALQGAYYLVAFCLPLEAKWRWNDEVHAPWLLPAQNIAVLVSLAVYWWAAMARYRCFQAWLEANSGQREELRLGWLRGFLWAVAFVVAVNVAFQAVDIAVTPLDYFDYFPFYLVLSGLTYYLGIEGWRHAALPLPAMAAAVAQQRIATPPSLKVAEPTAPASPAASDGVDPEPTGRDWPAIAAGWAEQVRAGRWWREPTLSLADLARRLGTNTQYLSRALNEGLGQSFSEFVNRQRVEDAQQRLREESSLDVLTIALEVGFGSKASFNRAFLAYTGATPTAWREAARRNR
jgi:AraC-like DNA-binding protein